MYVQLLVSRSKWVDIKGMEKQEVRCMLKKGGTRENYTEEIVSGVRYE